MSGATLAWAVAGMVAAVLAASQFLRASNCPQTCVRNGYRWLAVAAICLGAGGVVQQAFTGLIGGAQPLRVADLISLAALAALVIGLATLTAELPGGQHDRPTRWSASPVPGIVIDSCLLATSVFVICMVTAFGPDYADAGVGAGVFALDLIRPCADLIVIGLALRFVVRGPRQALLPALAVGVLTVGDCVAVAARADGHAAGAAPQAALVVALALLAVAPATGTAWPAGSGSGSGGSGAAGWSSPATLAALTATAAAALVVTGYALSGAPVATPALAVAGAIVILLLVIKLAELAFHASASAAAAQDSDSKFRALADTTIDVVMVCDPDGVVEYVSPAIAEYGYQPDQLIGTRLLDLMHPEDRLAGVSAAMVGLRATKSGGGAAAFAGRVRGADGSWRHVEASVSRYGTDDEPVRLLVTARDVSDRVELRRQVAHLTFHDGLTGLPNRAYVERRLADMRAASADEGGRAVSAEHDGRGGYGTRTGQGGHGGRAGRVRRDGRVGRAGWEGRAGRVARAGRDSDPGHGDPVQRANTVQRGNTEQRANTEQPGNGALVGVILLNLDGCTGVNELVGHSGGDLLLAQAARRLRAASPPEATVARWGGDEFAVLISDVGSEDEIVDLAERLAGQVAAEPFDVAGEQITLTVSAGVAVGALGVAAGDGTGGIDDVLVGAQAAMARVKEAGGGRVAAYAAEMHSAARRRAEMAGVLREAIAGERLELRYQPIVELATSTVTGVEALVRCNQAGQQLSPEELLTVADESGLTAELGSWVLREAGRQVAAWQAAGWNLGLSVNVSGRQAGAPRFAAWLIEQLDDVGLPPRALTVEVTEGLLVDGASPVAGELAGLRGKGVRLAIDDFGTGNFSLTHLRQLAVDVIKIDPSFVTGLGADPTVSLLTKAIIQLGGDLGVEVIAEGIERPEQLDQLLAMGCGLGQGFALAGPMTAAEMELLLAGQRRGKAVGRQVRDQADDQACSQAC